MNSCTLIVPIVSGSFRYRRRPARHSPSPRTGSSQSTPKRRKFRAAAVYSEGGPLAHEEVAFDRVRSEFDGSVVRAECLVAATCSCEKVGAGGMVWLVLAERGGVDPCERGAPLRRAAAARVVHRR